MKFIIQALCTPKQMKKNPHPRDQDEFRCPDVIKDPSAITPNYKSSHKDEKRIRRIEEADIQRFKNETIHRFKKYSNETKYDFNLLQ